MTVTPRVKLLCLAVCLLWAFPLCAEMPPRAELITAKRIGTTPPMANYLATHHPAPNAPVRVFPVRKPSSHPGKGNGGTNGGSGSSYTDSVLQTSTTGLSQNYSAPGGFDGLTSVGYVPPDTNISVGMYQSGGTTVTQIVETVNVDLAVYDASGNLRMGPAPINSIFTAAGGATSTCASTNGGDPIVLFDKIDQRWIISQLAYNMGFSNNHLCMAISNGPDAANAKYTAYDISFGKNLPDYPKMGIWTNGDGSSGTGWNSTAPQAGVYFSANMFAHGSSFIGAQMCSFPLSNVTDPTAPMTWTCVQNGTGVYNILPADLEGSPALDTPTSTNTTLPPPPNTAEYFMQFTGSKTLSLYQFDPGFTSGKPTVSGPVNIGVAAFQEACGGGSCIPQYGTSTQLDSLADRLMYRLSYRNYGGTTGQSMVVTHSVLNDSTSGTVGVRWYQLTNTSGTWNVHQQSTFGPSDGNYRWMGSIAQDKVGDLGIGYSVSSPTMFPDLAVTGWAVGDALNVLEPETFINIGNGYQSSVSRWGDYSSMSVAPVNDCTMWYANEYLTSSGSYTNWGTWIASMTFTGCH